MERQVQANRTDLLTVAATNRNCIGTIPPAGKKPKERVVVGDQSGWVTASGLGKGRDINQSFKTSGAPPNCQDKKQITSVLGGEKVFATWGEVVLGVNRKGASFYRLETNMTEPIRNLVVQIPKIWTTGRQGLNAFEENKEIAYFQSPDKINHLIVDPLGSETGNFIILGCQDRKIRVVPEGAEKEPPETHDIESGALTLQIYSTKGETNKDVVFGTVDGILGALRNTGSGGNLAPKWNLSNVHSAAGYNCLTTVDFSKDGSMDIAAGRDNGDFQLYSFMGNAVEPALVYQTALGESVTGLTPGGELGVLGNSRPEVLVSTFSGKILALSPMAEEEEPQAAGIDSPTKKQAKQEKSENQKQQIAELQAQVAKTRELLEKRESEYTAVSENHVPVVAEVGMTVNDKFFLDVENACWVLSVELQGPIEHVALSCDVDIELLDAPNSTAILSRTDPQSDTRQKLLAVYRNTEVSNRVEMRLRTTEGQYGTLDAFVIPALTPKTTQQLKYGIRPLSLHTRLPEAPDAFENLPLSVVTFGGQFQNNDMHAWVSKCLPEMPSKASSVSDENVLYFRSTFQGSVVMVKYSSGNATVKSDNLSALAIMRESISRQATEANKTINNTQTVSDASLGRMVELLNPRMQQQVDLSNKVKLIQGLQEIEMQEQDLGFMAQEYKDILAKAKDIEREFKLQPRRLEFLQGIYGQLLLHKNMFKGKPAPTGNERLKSLLEDYQMETLKEFFIEA